MVKKHAEKDKDNNNKQIQHTHIHTHRQTNALIHTQLDGATRSYIRDERFDINELEQ